MSFGGLICSDVSDLAFSVQHQRLVEATRQLSARANNEDVVKALTAKVAELLKQRDESNRYRQLTGDQKKILERFPLGLNRDSQGVRKGGVLGGDSAL